MPVDQSPDPRAVHAIWTLSDWIGLAGKLGSGLGTISGGYYLLRRWMATRRRKQREELLTIHCTAMEVLWSRQVVPYLNAHHQRLELQIAELRKEMAEQTRALVKGCVAAEEAHGLLIEQGGQILEQLKPEKPLAPVVPLHRAHGV